MSDASTDLIPFHEALPCLDEPFPHDILILGLVVGVLIEDVRHVLVHVGKKGAHFGTEELVEELFDARTKDGAELRDQIIERRDTRFRNRCFLGQETLSNRGRRNEVFDEPLHMRGRDVEVVQEGLNGS